MNADVKIVDQNLGSSVSGSAVQPQAGSPNKEVPIATTELSEMQPAGSERKHDIGQELEGLGIKEIQDRPDLTQVPDIQHAGPHVPVSIAPTSSIRYSMSEEEVTRKKTGKIDDSETWNATLLDKVIKAGKLVGRILGF